MSRILRSLIVVLGLLLLFFFVVACQTDSVAPPATPFTAWTAEPAEQSLRVEITSTPSLTATPLPPPPTATPLPSITSSPTATPLPTLEATRDVARGLPCPEPYPEKPDYRRYYLAPEPWPAPDRTISPPSFMLSDPLPYAARNVGYPYGSDGSGRYLLHNGLDMAHEEDDFAVAAADGTVIVARDDVDEMFGWRCDWYGQLVVIQLNESWQEQVVFLLYGHVTDIQVEEGQKVQRGDPIAREGSAGVATVPHLHFEVRVGENAFNATRNPLLWIEPWSGSGVIAGRLIDPDGRPWQGVTMTLIDKSGNTPFLNTWTYLDDPDHLIQPDPALGENFVFGPVEAGFYDVYTQVQGVEYRQPVEVRDGELVTLDLVTEPYKTPTPVP